MDNQEYLKQISSMNRPNKKPKVGFLSSPFFKVAVGGVVAFVLIAIIGSVLSGGKASIQEQTIALKLQLDNTLSVISDYQPNIKSSDLRSGSASLYGVLSNTSRELTEYITEQYSYKSGSESEAIKEEATTHKDELAADLFEAKINGTLDRIFAHKMALEISLITTKEASIYDASSNESLRSLLTTSYNSLNNLYDKFSNFSETK